MSQLTDTFTSMANAIREKTGSTSAFTPAQMITEIENIPTGGGGIATYILPYTYASSTITSYTGNENLILDYAFASCRSLSNISFPECTSIGRDAFVGCYSLTSISFPQCTYIGTYAFYNCSSLSNISFPECGHIGSYAFYDCGLTNISFPKCSYIGSNAFVDCYRLTNITFPKCSYIGSNAFVRCTGLTSAIFPECTYIESNAFNTCYRLTNISFPKCSYIGSSAFCYCSSLSSLYLLSTSVVSLANSNAFNMSPLSATGTGNIYVPSSLYDTYVSANNWSTISARITSYNG